MGLNYYNESGVEECQICRFLQFVYLILILSNTKVWAFYLHLYDPWYMFFCKIIYTSIITRSLTSLKNGNSVNMSPDLSSSKVILVQCWKASSLEEWTLYFHSGSCQDWMRLCFLAVGTPSFICCDDVLVSDKALYWKLFLLWLHAK